MVPAFDDVQKVRCLHFCAHLLKEIQGTKRIARALHKQDWRIQRSQNFVPEFFPIAHRAKRISETNKRVHFFFERHMTPDPATHALADQDGRFSRMSFSRLAQYFPVCRDQFWQGIGAFPTVAHVVIIETLNVTDFGQTNFPILHPGMG
jgi:hypothetical protein